MVGNERPSPELDALLNDFHALKEHLADASVRVIHVSSQGGIKIQRDARWHQGELKVESSQVDALGRALGLPSTSAAFGTVFGAWNVEILSSSGGAHLVFERRPRGDVSTIPRGVIATLEQEVARGACGLILGPPTSASEELLAHLAMSRDEAAPGAALYVGPAAPLEESTPSIMHLHPPGAASQGFMRVLRSFPFVMWQDVKAREDLVTLFSHPGVEGRWASIVSADVERTLSGLRGLGDTCPDLDVEVLLVLGPFDKGVALTRFARRVDGRWQETLGNDQRLIAALETTFPAPAELTNAPLEEESEALLSSSGRVSEEFDIASLLESARAQSKASQKSGEVELRQLFKKSSAIENYDDEPPTGELVLDASSWPLNDAEGNQNAQVTNVLRGDALDRIMPMIEAHADIADLQIGQVSPDQLRQTIEGEVDVKALRAELMKAVARDRKIPAPATREEEKSQPGIVSEPAPGSASPALDPREQSGWGRGDLSRSGMRNIIREETSTARDESQRPSRPLSRVIPKKAEVEEKTAEIDVPRAWQDLSRPSPKKDS